MCSVMLSTSDSEGQRAHVMIFTKPAGRVSPLASNWLPCRSARWTDSPVRQITEFRELPIWKGGGGFRPLIPYFHCQNISTGGSTCQLEFSLHFVRAVRAFGETCKPDRPKRRPGGDVRQLPTGPYGSNEGFAAGNKPCANSVICVFTKWKAGQSVH